MLDYIFFVFLAGFVSYAFKIVVGLLFGSPLLLLSLFKSGTLEDVFYEHPIGTVIYGAINHAIAGALYAYVIYATSFYFLSHYNGNGWVYLTLAIIWSLTGLGSITGFPEVFFMTCTVGLLTLWFGDYHYLTALVIVTIMVASIYYYRKINRIMEA